jgi:hypothetical protein
MQLYIFGCNEKGMGMKRETQDNQFFLRKAYTKSVILVTKDVVQVLQS